MIKLVAFDWNGTVFADTYAILDSVNEILKSFNLKTITLTAFQKYFDVPVYKAYLDFGIPKNKVDKEGKQIAGIFHRTYEPRAEKVRTRAYAKKLLVWLSRNGVKSIIFSNHIDEPIKRQLKRLEIDKYFSAVLANSQLETAFKGRAKQEKLSSYIKDNNFKESEVLIIGDTVEEVEIGKGLGTITVALTHGNCSISRLKATKPDFLISSLEQVINIIKKVN